MKLVFTGGRDNYSAPVEEILDLLKPTEVFVGDALGVDSTVQSLCLAKAITVGVYIANWDKHGRAAGPIRNEKMLTEAGSDAILVAFDGGRGTESCTNIARSKGMLIMKVPNYAK